MDSGSKPWASQAGSVEPKIETTAVSQPTSTAPSTSPPKQNTALPAASTPTSASYTILQPKQVVNSTAINSTSNGNSSATPRLRSSIACARCRKSKIKCTNAGAGTTCEACAHSGRECIYPAPGTGGLKREGEGDENGERTKRPRARKSEPMPDKIDFAIKTSNSDFLRAQIGLQTNHAQIAVKPSSLQAPKLSGRIWTEVFDIFQTHYGTELSFLHAPTFLPRLADDPAMYAAMTGQSRGQVKSHDLIQLGILTLAAKHHEGLIRQFSPQATRNGSSNPTPAIETSEHFAATLKVLIFNSDQPTISSSLEHPELGQIQALLMLSLFEWSVRRGSSAWIYLGIAIRMAQAMEIFNEDLDTSATSSESFNGTMSSALLHASKHSNLDLDNSEAFVQEEEIRRTVWSCFLLDRYFSNGSSRPSGIDTEKLHVQMPCGEKAWAFGDRVCTPFFNGLCSHQRDRTRKNFDHSCRFGSNKASRDERMSTSMVESMISRIPCEYEQDEGLIGRLIRLVDLWGGVARWSYQGGKRSRPYASWDEKSTYWTINSDLRRLVEDMPRSFRFTKANIQAHLAQHTAPPFTLLHIIYSTCKLIMLREFLPFAPANLSSPSQVDDIEIKEPTMYNRRWHSNSINELFRVSHDLLDLIQTCKARSVLPAGPLAGFGVYLAAFVGIYAIHFPQMDVEGWVYGKDMDSNTLSERQIQIAETIQVLASMRSHLPMAQYWFRTLHRAHAYYRQLNVEKTSNQMQQGDRLSPNKDSSDRNQASGVLDAIFRRFGDAEDDGIVFVLPRDEPVKSSVSYTEKLPSPQPIWKPVNAAPPSRYVDPLDRAAPQVGPQAHAKWYQARGDPVGLSKTSGYEQGGSFSATNTLPPINATGSLHSYPPTPPSAPMFKTPTQTLLFFSGEDVALFLDSRSEEDISAMKIGWKIIKSDKEPSIIGSPNYRAQELKRMESIGVGWVGALWQWA